MITTERLRLRRPVAADAEAIFARYASDPDVTKFVGWPQHQLVEHSRGFVLWSDSEWEKWPAGPYLIESLDDGGVLGSTGLSFESPTSALTGYVIAKDAWGLGYATEALAAMTSLASDLGVRELAAVCHPDHRPSQRVLEKGGFSLSSKRVPTVFPNLDPNRSVDAFKYVY
jgi:ribosomal-protein-alanine N-acetyltransferase